MMNRPGSDGREAPQQRTPRGSDRRARSLASALALLLAVWILLLAGGLAASRLGEECAVLLTFGLITALVRGARTHRSARPPAPVLCLGLAAGYAGFPAWVALIAALGTVGGLAPVAPSLPGRGGPALWVAVVVLAPVFEELLYRERLLEALRSNLGTAPAVLVSSLLFALPHALAWNVLGAALVGGMLAAVRLLGHSTGLCVALHAGLNLAAMLCGAPPVRFAAPPAASAALGCGLTAAALSLLGFRRAGDVRATSRPCEGRHA